MINSGETKGGLREYQKRQLPIVLAPAIFTLLAIAASTWMPGKQLMTWGVVAGMAWVAIGWLVFQVRVSRARKGGGGSSEGQETTCAGKGGLDWRTR